MASATTQLLDSNGFFNVINNELLSTSETRNGIDPSTGKALPPVPVAKEEDVDRAVAYARKALPAWRKTPWEERAALVDSLADAVEANKAFFLEWLIKEIGKPHQTSTVEFGLAVGLLRQFAKLRIDEEVIEDTEDRRAKVRYVPVGVCAGLIPWNWPLVIAVGKIGSALVTGNTMIVKPSPFTPYCGLKIVELAARIFPPGVLQALSGEGNLGPMLTEHPDIDLISFTGSTATGKRVMKSCASTLKRVILELGGNDPAIICEDVEIDSTAAKIAKLTFFTGGQTCMNIKRIYIHSAIYDKFRDALVAHVRQLPVGSPADEATFIGPVQNAMQHESLTNMFSDIDKQGWTPALGSASGIRPRPNGEGGYFFEPVLIDNPPDSSRIVVEEPFGPIAPILKWTSEDEVIARANDSKYALGASVWTTDLDRGERIANELEAGSVWVNTHFELSPAVPFGGLKWSGVGSEWGVVGMKAYCSPQAQWVRRK